MNEEISRVLTMMEEGKLDKEKAAELITVLRGSESPLNLEKSDSNSYLDKMLKVRITSESGDNVNVNLPIRLVKTLLKVGTSVAGKVPQAEKYVKDLDIDMILDAIDHELEGQIVDITTAKGEKVLVVIE